jgi:hypothetical protein
VIFDRVCNDYFSHVDHLFQLGVNFMYHEAMYLAVQDILKAYGSAGQILPPTRLSM